MHPDERLNDHGVFYFDGNDQSWEAEDRVIQADYPPLTRTNDGIDELQRGVLRMNPRFAQSAMFRAKARKVSSVSAPVFGLHWRLLGSVCISGPKARLPEVRLMELAQTVMTAANELSYAIAGTRRPGVMRPSGAAATWHP